MTSPAKSTSSHGSNDEDGSLSMREGTDEPLDPLDPRRVSLDMFELYCHEMLTTPFVGRRAFLVDKMRYMIGRLIGEQYDYGRLYNRTCVANMVARLCGRHAYQVPSDGSEVQGDKSSYHIRDCLVEFTPRKWEKVIDQFQGLRTSLLRNDATYMVLPSELETKGGKDGEDEYMQPESDDGIDEVMESHDDFSKWYNKMLDMMRFHACVSHLQPQLEGALQESEEGGDSVVISRDDIVAFDSAIEEHFGDEEESKYARILRSLLEVNKKRDGSSRYGEVRLRSFGDIREVYERNHRVFDLEGFQHKFLQLIRRWTELVLPVPELAKLGYGAAGDNGARKPMAALSTGKENVLSPVKVEKGGQKPPPKRQKRTENRKSSPVEPEFEQDGVDEIESSSDEGEGKEGAEATGATDNLTRTRKAFMRKVKDPLDSCVAIAESARTKRQTIESDSDSEKESNDDGKKRGVKTPSFMKQKKSAKSLVFTDSSDDDESEEEEGKGLSEVPPKFNPPKRAEKPEPIRVSRKKSIGKKRRRFTEEEDSAIRLGVERFGHGKWADIKAYYNMALKDRNQVQIKDRWRTLSK